MELKHYAFLGLIIGCCMLYVAQMIDERRSYSNLNTALMGFLGMMLFFASVGYFTFAMGRLLWNSL